MQYRFLVNGDVVVNRAVTPRKQKADIYEYYDYIIAQAFFNLRRWLLVKHNIDTDADLETNVFAESINVYVNEARSESYPRSFSKTFIINGKSYTFKMVDERLKLTY